MLEQYCLKITHALHATFEKETLKKLKSTFVCGNSFLCVQIHVRVIKNLSYKREYKETFCKILFYK